MKNLRDGFDEQCFRKAGRARDEAMPAGQEREHDLFNHLALADNHLAQLGVDFLPRREELLDDLLLGRLRQRRRGGGSDGGFRGKCGGFVVH